MDRIQMNRPRRRRRARRRRMFGPLLAVVLTVALILVAGYYISLFPKQIEEKLYPLSYEDLINQYAQEYSLDPARVAAVIYCESSFRPDAVSNVGAIGLMQIMPETGTWLATKFDMANYTEEMLYDPETNIRFGCWYLNYLDERFDGDLTKATAAYHAGGGRVDEWLDDQQYSSDGATLENIPYKATNAYVKNVRSVYEKYKEIIKV